MEHTNYTPGPWEAKPRDDSGWDIHAADDGQHILYMGDDPVELRRDPHRKATMDADARLIAAAPEVAEALKLIAKADDGANPNPKRALGDVAGHARHVLQKAGLA